MWVYGWDLVDVEEKEDVYLFKLAKRNKPEDMVWFTLARYKQYAEMPYYPEKMYQLYMANADDSITERLWLRKQDFMYHNLSAIIEGTLDKHYGHA